MQNTNAVEISSFRLKKLKMRLQGRFILLKNEQAHFVAVTVVPYVVVSLLSLQVEKRLLKISLFRMNFLENKWSDERLVTR